MAGIFHEWQPRYDEAGIATIPVRADKRPYVQHWRKSGRPASRRYRDKFGDAEGLGIVCGKFSGIAVLDVDEPDERVFADALAERGPTPIIIRTGGRNWQAWYRWSGEKRKIKLDGQPIDILGEGGFVVAPPSHLAKGPYEFVEGSLADIASLPTMRRIETPAPIGAPADDRTVQARIRTGQRNDALWRACLGRAPQCPTITQLMEFAVQMNQTECYEPLPDMEVMRVVASAWAKEASGENWIGRGKRVVVHHDEIDTLLTIHPDAFILLMTLRRQHWARDFVIANAMAETMPGGGWPRKRFAAARRYLEEAGEIEMIRPASPVHGPAVYRFKGGHI